MSNTRRINQLTAPGTPEAGRQPNEVRAQGCRDSGQTCKRHNPRRGGRRRNSQPPASEGGAGSTR